MTLTRPIVAVLNESALGDLKRGYRNGTARVVSAGAGSYSETLTLDWLGRQTCISDTFGKHIQYTCDDADRLREVNDLATNKSTAYTDDCRGHRKTETLTIGGAVVRDTAYTYNERGWLTGVDGSLGFSAGGSSLNQDAHLFFRYDESGNRSQRGRAAADRDCGTADGGCSSRQNPTPVPASAAR